MGHRYESAWEVLAETRPLQSISTKFGNAEDRFWASGKRTAEFLLQILPHGTSAHQTALDFGVGIGRVAFPLSDFFECVVGVDVSHVMLKKLAREAVRQGNGRVMGHHIDAAWDDVPVDFVYSVLTFQHMPHDEVRSALKRLARVTRGCGYFQFDTRRSFFGALTRFVPDTLLPWTWRAGMRRIHRTPEMVRTWLAEAGFRINQEFQPSTALHGFLVVPEAKQTDAF